ncbi:MAG: hypothetical protein Q7S58_07465 [Candidatus Binatus sp.]|uniref:hypothetical protein n=1 Tax=Candidatus Binatus sp. TaxID=2811406 RepID=UPI00271738D4|nr:hypothetical protein [Candidatus Binatus sp.]MDO8432233.1 hypothetical protein [Candidatus Binatus sp.]
MAETILEGVESIRVVRVDGNLKLRGAESSESGKVIVDSSDAPEIIRNANVVEISTRSNATISIPPGVAIDVEDVAGNLDASDFAAPLFLTRVRGNFHARRIGAVTIRDSVAGNFSLKESGSVEGRKISGSLNVESSRSISLRGVAGDFYCRGVEGEIAIEKISGAVRLNELRGPFISRLVGGNLEVETATEVEAGVVGGKLRAQSLSGALRAGKIGGKLAVDGVGGEVGVGFVGGNVRIGKVGGALTLEEVGGAIDLSGPYPAGKSWSIRSRGRVSVDVDDKSSIEFDAASGWGRIRTYGIDDAQFKWRGRNHVHGTIGPEIASAENAEGGRLKLTIETKVADIIVAMAGSRERDFHGRGDRGFGRAFGAPFEELAREIGEDVPAFVRTVMDAAGKFVADTGPLPTGIIRDVKRSVSQGLREVERAFGEIEKSVPADAGEKLSRLGKEIGELVSQAVRGGTREARGEMRDRVRAAAREMRDTIRTAARERWSSGEDESPKSPAASKAAEEKSASASARPGATEKLKSEDAIMDILAAVKEGRLEPDEADDLIKAWMEVSRGTDAHR